MDKPLRETVRPVPLRQDEATIKRSTVQHALVFVLAVAGGLLLSLTGFFTLHRWEMHSAQDHAASDFYVGASDRIRAIQRESDKHWQVIRALGAFYDASQRVTRQEFHTFASRLLEANPSIQALEWIPRVARSERTRYEDEARESIPRFRITERHEDGTLVPASLREAYYPVYFVEPYAGNEPTLGFDLASEPFRREALQRARDSGEPAASRRMTLVQESGQQYGFLVYLPIYQRGVPLMSVAQRRQHLEGFVLGVCRLGELVEQALAHLEGRSIDLWLFDTTADSEPQLLHYYASLGSPNRGSRSSREPATTDLQLSDTLQMGGHQLKVVAAPAPGSLLPSVPYTAWVALIAGLAITALFARYLNALHTHALRLAQTNRSLDREIVERRQTEGALKDSEARFRQILETAADAIVISDEHGRILNANSQAEWLFGYARHELINQSVELLLPEALRDEHATHRRRYYADPQARPMGPGLEIFARRKDGNPVPVDISLSPVDYPEGPIVTAIVRDMTERKQTEANLRRLNRTYAVLSRCNHILARTIVEEELLNAFCSILVEVGGYRFAWIGYAQHNEAKNVRVMAHAGDTVAEFSVTAVTWSDVGEKRSACGMAIRTGKPVVLRDIHRESDFAPWREAALQQGYRSMIALPLKTDVHAFGNLSIFSPEYNAFDGEEVALLMELAEDLAFGIGTLRARAARAHKVRLLREEVEREEQKRLAAALHDGIGQSMQAVNLGLKRLRALAGKEKQLSMDLLVRIIDDVRQVIADLRNVTHDLRAPFLERMGLLEAVRYHCNELGERSGVLIHVASTDESSQLDGRVKEQCFLCFREALNNAIAHAKASRIDVTLETLGAGWLSIRVADDGRGFNPEESWKAPSGLGLSMIAERAESVGGHAELHSAPGEGTTVSITVPVEV